MPSSVERLSPILGAQVHDVDACESLADQAIGGLRSALWEHQMLLLRDQNLSKDEFIRFAHGFGEIEPFFLEQYRDPERPEIYVLSNAKKNGKTVGRSGAGTHWHTDHTFMERPASITMLYALEVPPEGGDTLFVDTYGAYERLDSSTKQELEGLRAVHHYQTKEHIYSAANSGDRTERTSSADRLGQANISERQKRLVPDVKHPIARTHPVTGKKALYLNEGMTVGVDGMATEQAKSLLGGLCEQATQAEHVFRHRWRAGDVLMWDNASVLHAATFTDPKFPRTLHRITIAGTQTY